MKRQGKRWAATIGFAAAFAGAAIAIAAPGDLDTSFSGDGKQTIDFGTTSEAGLSHAIAADGTIYGTGTRLSGSSNLDDFQVYSLKPDGTPNADFSTDGKQTVGFASNTTDNSRAVLIQPNGRIIVGGTTNMSPSGSGTSDQNFGLARLLPTGNLDQFFSEDGVIAAEVSGADSLLDMAFDSEGRIVAVGTSGAKIGVARFLPTGELDFTFDLDGVRTLDLGQSEKVKGVAIDSSDRILISGSAKPSAGAFGSSDFFLIRVQESGQIDPSFANNGVLDTGIAAGHEEDGGDVAIGPDGRIVVAGWAGTPAIPATIYDPAVPSEINIAAFRVSPNGSFDDSFSGDGRAMFDIGPSDFGAALAITPASKLVIGGESGPVFTVVQVRANGTLDPGFGTGGVKSVSFGVPFAASALGAVRLTREGDITASGQMKPTGTTDSMAIVKLEGDPIDLDTQIDSGPPSDQTLTDGAISFGFSSDSPGVVGFECAWPNEQFEACTSPVSREVTDGEKTFRVRAINILGSSDATPAARTFTIDTTAPFITIRRRSLRLGEDGKTAAKIRCGFERSDPCQGKLSVRTVGKFRLGDAAAAAKSKTVKLAQAKFSIESEAKPTKIKLDIDGARKLKLLRRNELARKINVTVRVRDQVGNKDLFIKEMRVKV